MKTKNILSAIFIAIFTISFAQDPVFNGTKELTLSTSVMEQWRSFYPQVTTNFNWIPGTNRYSTFGQRWDEIKIHKADGSLESSITLATINNILGTELRWLSGFEWKNENEFYVADGTKYYVFDLSKKSGSLIFEAPKNAANTSLNAANQGVYTIDNNIGVFNGNKNVQATNLTDKNHVAGQAIARSEFGITGGLFWSPTGSKIGFYQKDESEVHDYPLLDINSTPGEVDFIKYPMAGQKSEKAKVGVYNLNDGQLVYLEKYGTEEDQYLTNFGWGPNEKFIYVAQVNRDQNHMKLLKFDAGNGKFIKVLFEEKNDKWVEPEHPVYFLKSNPKQFIWMSERDGFMNLYLYDTEGNLVKQLTKNKWVAQEILGEDASGKNVIFQGTGENPLNTMVYKVSLKNGKQTEITKVAGTHACQLSGDGNLLFDSYSNHNTPKVEQILDLNGKVKQELGKADNPLTEYRLGSAEISTIEAKDGTTLHTRMIKPSNFDPSKKYPVLVYVYGGPHAQLVTNSWLDGASLWMYWLAEQGYIVYTVDNRGSANRGFEFESVIHRNLGKYEMEDQLKGVDFLKSQSYIDANRIAVHGWSFGGYMTTSLMLKHPGVYTTGVAGGPVTDWNYYEIMYGERYMDRPSQNEDGYKETNLSNHVENLKGDLLLIHGTVDDVVVMQHNFKLVKSFVDKGVQVDFFPYPMHKHNVRGKDRVHLMQKVLDYVIEHNQ